MRENRIVTWAIAVLLVISIMCGPVARETACASHSGGLSRPDPFVVPRDFLQQMPRIESRNETRSLNKPHGSGEFYFLPHVKPELNDEAPLVPGDWC